jgi:hypothetical protein
MESKPANTTKSLLEEIRELLWCKDMLCQIWNDVDPNCFPQHIWNSLNSYFSCDKEKK